MKSSKDHSLKLLENIVTSDRETGNKYEYTNNKNESASIQTIQNGVSSYITKNGHLDRDVNMPVSSNGLESGEDSTDQNSDAGLPSLSHSRLSRSRQKPNNGSREANRVQQHRHIMETSEVLHQKLMNSENLNEEVYMKMQDDIYKAYIKQASRLYQQYKHASSDKVHRPLSGQRPPEQLLNNGEIEDRTTNSNKSDLGKYLPDSVEVDHGPKSAVTRIDRERSLSSSLNPNMSAKTYRRTRSLSPELREKKYIQKTDHQLQNSNNDKILFWLKQKNIEFRKKLKRERQRKRAEYRERVLAANDKLERRLESENIVRSWMKEKLRQQNKEKQQTLSEQSTSNLPSLRVSRSFDETDYGRGRYCAKIMADKRKQNIKSINIQNKPDKKISIDGLRASSKSLSTRPLSAKFTPPCSTEKENEARMSYDNWLISKRKDDEFKKNKDKNESIKQILVTNSQCDQYNNSVSVFGFKSDEAFDLPIFDVTLPTNGKTCHKEVKCKKLKTNMRIRKRKTNSRCPAENVFMFNVPFPPQEGCPVYVNKVQQKYFPFVEKTKNDELRNRDSAKIIKHEDDIHNKNLDMSKHTEIARQLEQAIFFPFSSKENQQEMTDGEKDFFDESNVPEDLLPEENHTPHIKNKIITNNKDINGLSGERRSSVKHVVFSDEAPQINEYEQIELEAECIRSRGKRERKSNDEQNKKAACLDFEELLRSRESVHEAIRHEKADNKTNQNDGVFSSNFEIGMQKTMDTEEIIKDDEQLLKYINPSESSDITDTDHSVGEVLSDSVSEVSSFSDDSLDEDNAVNGRLNNSV